MLSRPFLHREAVGRREGGAAVEKEKRIKGTERRRWSSEWRTRPRLVIRKRN